MFLTEQRLFRILAAKTGVVFGLLLGLLTATSTIVYAVGALLGRSTYPLAAFTTDATAGVGRAMERIGSAALILFGFAVAAVVLSAIMRHRVGAVFAGVVVIGLLNLGSSLDLIGELTPFGVIVDLAGLSIGHGTWEAVMVMPPMHVNRGGPAVEEFSLLARLGATALWTAAAGLLLGQWLRSKDLIEG